MDATGQTLLKLMFNPDESICVSKNQFASHSIPIKNAMSGRVTLFPPNPEHPTIYCDSSELLLVAINPIQGFRSDSNVYKFRSFLFELDVGDTKSQVGYFKHMKIPLSSQIFSGNKSVHAVLVLDKDLPSEKVYRYLYRWALNILTMCDPLCKNPSRSVRIPGAYREPNKKQELIWLGERVKLEDFMAWLKQYDHLKPIIRTKKKKVEGEDDYSRLSIWARASLKEGIDFKNGRNATWFALAYDFALAGFSIDRATEILLSKFSEEHDFKEKELLVAIGSAFKSVEEKR